MDSTEESLGELFAAAIEAISSDRFLLFIDKFTLKHIAPPPSRSCGDESLSAALPGAVHWVAWSPMGDESSARPAWAPLSEFAPRHHEVFGQYQALFESRLKTTLRQAVARAPDASPGQQIGLSPADFFALCEVAVNAGGLPSAGADDRQEQPTTATLCRALLSMVEAVTDFSTFVAMMADKEVALLSDDDDDDDDVDDY